MLSLRVKRECLISLNSAGAFFSNPQEVVSHFFEVWRAQDVLNVVTGFCLLEGHYGDRYNPILDSVTELLNNTVHEWNKLRFKGISLLCLGWSRGLVAHYVRTRAIYSPCGVTSMIKRMILGWTRFKESHIRFCHVRGGGS